MNNRFQKSSKPAWIQINGKTDLSLSDTKITIDSSGGLVEIQRETFETIKDLFLGFSFPAPKMQEVTTEVAVTQKVVTANFVNKTFKKPTQSVITNELRCESNTEYEDASLCVMSYTAHNGEEIVLIDNRTNYVSITKEAMEKIIGFDENDFVNDNVLHFPDLKKAV